MDENKAALREALTTASAVTDEALSLWLWQQAKEATDSKTAAMLFEASARLEPQEDDQ